MPRLSIRRLATLVGLLTVGPSLVLAALWISTYVLSLPLLAALDVIGIAPMLLSELPLLCLFLVFSILFKAVPNAPVVARHALLGGLLTAAVFKLAFELFAWLFRLFGLRRDIWCAGCIARVLALALRSLGSSF